MKKYVLHSLFAIFGTLLLSQAIYAGQYYKPIQNRVGVYTELGADAWLSNSAELKNSVGAGLGIGFTYEMQREKFLLNIGVGVNALYNPVKMAGGEYVLRDQIDLDPLYGGGEKMDYYYFTSNRKDQYLSMNIQVPILLGFTSDRFFMLGGVKLGYMLNVLTNASTQVQTKGYNATIGWMENMPMYQYYPGRTLSSSSRCTMKPDVAVSLELGGYVGTLVKGTGYNRFRSKKNYRVSVFADYGLTQINQKSILEPFTTPQRYTTPSEYDMVNAASLRDAISSNIAGKVTNLFVGVKFTALFDLPEPRQCVLCRSDLRFVPRLSKTGKMPSKEKPSQGRR